MKRLATLSAFIFLLSSGLTRASAQQERPTAAPAAPEPVASESVVQSPEAAPVAAIAANTPAAADSAEPAGGSVRNAAISSDDQGTKAKGKKGKKEKKVKLTSVTITGGTLTVDGWTGKAQLNYDIANLQYLYFYAPGVGTAVVSNLKFPGATEQKDAFSQGALTLMIDGHMIQLQSSTHLIRGKKDESAWVKLDTTFSTDSKFPIMGYGGTPNAPYVWPGAKPQDHRSLAASVAPPLPTQMRPKLLTVSCVAGPGRVCPAATGSLPAGGTAPQVVPAAASSSMDQGRSNSESAVALVPGDGQTESTPALPH